MAGTFPLSAPSDPEVIKASNCLRTLEASPPLKFKFPSSCPHLSEQVLSINSTQCSHLSASHFCQDPDCIENTSPEEEQDLLANQSGAFIKLASDGQFSVSTWLDMDTKHFSDIVLGVSVGVFLVGINSWISRLSKQIALPNVRGPHLISWRSHRIKGLTFLKIKGIPPAWLRSWDIGPFLPSGLSWNIGSSWVWSHRLSDWNSTTHLLCWVSSLLTDYLETCQPL